MTSRDAMGADRGGSTGPSGRLWPLILVGVALYASGQMVGVVVPIHVTRTLGGTGSDVGFVAATATVGALVGRSVAGRLTHATGPRWAFAGAGLAMALVCLVYVAFDDVIVVAGLRFIHLAGFAIATSSYTIAAAGEATDSNRGHVLGRAHLPMHLALLFSAPLGVQVLRNDLDQVGGVAALLLVVAALFIFVVVRSDRRTASTAGAPGPPGVLGGRTRRAPNIAACTAAAALGMADGVAMDLIPLIGVDRGIDPYSVFYTGFALSALVVLSNMGRVLGVADELTVRKLALTLLAGSFIGLAFVSGATVLFMLGVLFGVGFGAAQTTISLFFAERNDGRSQAQNLALFYLWLDIGRAVGVYGIAAIIDVVGGTSAMLTVAACILAALIVLRVSVNSRGRRS